MFIGIYMAMVCIGLSFLLLLQFRIVFKKGTREMMTLQEIAKVEGVSHQAIAEILTRALRKIRIELQKRNINLEDLL